MYTLANNFEQQNIPEQNTQFEFNQQVQAKESEEYTIGDIISCLFEVRDNAHIQHFKTTSYAKHMALDELYKEIIELTDSLVESWQGKYGIISGYAPIEIHEEMDILEYLHMKLEYIAEFKASINESFILNQLDAIEELIYSSIYKLQNLN